MTIQLVVKSDILDGSTLKIQTELGPLVAAQTEATGKGAGTITLTTKDAALESQGARGVQIHNYFPKKANFQNTPTTVKRMS